MQDINVLIVGGGAHGVGLLHDFATRGVDGVLLVEKNILASGTSSRSTKLVHGGLRYLERLSQWPLVYEALHERTLLLNLLKGMTQPVPILLPNFVNARPAWFVQMGLYLYDSLAGESGLPRSKKISKNEIKEIAPYLKHDIIDEKINSAFLYYDGQMLDDVIVRVAAFAAKKLGAAFQEHTSITSVTPRAEGGFLVTLITEVNGEKKSSSLTCKYLINAAGAWCNANLLEWGFLPTRACLLNTGSHILFSSKSLAHTFKDDSPRVGTMLQDPDGRVVFFVPWKNSWLFGTTESVLAGKPDKQKIPEADKNYLLKTAYDNFLMNPSDENVEEMFCGVRCMPLKKGYSQSLNVGKTVQQEWKTNPYSSPFYVNETQLNISHLSRETIIEETIPQLYSIYGGKYTTYRSASEKLAGEITRKMKWGCHSGTHLLDNWFLEELLQEQPEIFLSPSSIRQF